MEIIKHNHLAAAAAIVKDGKVLVYPTDTVWGIGGNALDKTVRDKVIKAKNNSAGAKLIWLLPSIPAVKKHFPKVTMQEQRLLRQKRTTVIIEDTGIRVVKTGWVNKLLTACGVPLLSTSANLHGQKTVESWRQAAAVFDGRADAVIIGRKVYNGKPSKIVKVEGTEVIQIR